MTASARQRLTRLLLVVAIAVVGLVTGCATAPGGSAAAPGASACGSGRAEWTDPFCGARLRGSAAVLCALPGNKARPAFLLNGAAIAAPLPDTSFIYADLVEASSSAEAAAYDAGDPPPPCALQVRTLDRNWPSITDPGRAADRYASIALQIDTSFTGTTSQCRVQSDPTGWMLVRETVFREHIVTRALGIFRSSDADQAMRRDATEAFLRTLKITIQPPFDPARDTSTVRQRYRMAISMKPAIPDLLRDTVGFETGAAACDRLERRTLERVRREAR